MVGSILHGMHNVVYIDMPHGHITICHMIMWYALYALSIWGNCNECSKNMIFRLQKRAARIVTGNFDYINVRGQDIMNELGWRTLEQIFFTMFNL